MLRMGPALDRDAAAVMVAGEADYDVCLHRFSSFRLSGGADRQCHPASAKIKEFSLEPVGS